VETVKKPRSSKKGNAAAIFVYSLQIKMETCQAEKGEICPVHIPMACRF